MKKLLSIILCVCLMTSTSYAEKITDLFKDHEVTQQKIQLQTGWFRIVNTLENITGKEVTIKSLEPMQDYMFADVETDSWANGYWCLKLCEEIPDLTEIKNSIWFCYYDESYHKLGYVLGVHIKVPTATNSNVTVERF